MAGLTVTNSSEETLVTSAKNGDRAAFERLLEIHHDALLAWVRGRIGERLRGKVDAEDVTQEAQLRAYQSLDRFSWRGPASFRNWLRAIAEHVVWSLSQKKSTGERKLAIDAADEEVSPSRNMRRDERFDRLESAMSKLRDDERTAVRLARLEGLSIREIAAAMGKGESAVKSLVARSLRKLRESFGDTESLHLPDRLLDDGGREP